MDGTITVDINKESTSAPECAMSDGTFEKLCVNPVVFLQNNNGFDAVIGSITGPILTIRSNNLSSTDVINWMVIAERADYHIIDSTHTNESGYLITEHDSGP